MRWEDFRRSENVEDRRDEGYGGGGIGIPIGMGSGGLGIGGLIILGLLAFALGIDPRVLLDAGQIIESPRPGQFERTRAPSAGRGGVPDDRQGQFVAAVLAQTEDVWQQVFQESGRRYRPPKLVLFSGMTRSDCVTAQTAMGPFYCPLDQRVYLDLSFFRDMGQRLQLANEFAQAYVIAHEVGHHVQNLMGILPRVHQQRQSLPKAQGNQLSVRLELQADCFAGVWAHHADARYRILEAGDVEKAMAAASAVGDDRLQRRAQGHAVPDSFTHGSSAQRVRWFTTGLKSGSLQQCNTFSAGVQP